MGLIWATPGFDEWPLDRWHTVLSALSRRGFSGIEPLIMEPYRMPAGQIKELLEEHRLSLFGVRTGGITMKHKVTFNDADEENRAQAVRRFKEVNEYIAQFGQPRLLVGLMQGNMRGGQRLDQAEETIGGCLRECADDAAKFGLELDLEAVNRFEVNHHNTLMSARNFIRSIDAANMHLLIDTFHMNIEEADIDAAIQKARDNLGHVHLSDSNRRVPGFGHYPFGELFDTLQKIKYQGELSIEANTDSSEGEIIRAAEYLHKFEYIRSRDENH